MSVIPNLIDDDPCIAPTVMAGTRPAMTGERSVGLNECWYKLSRAALAGRAYWLTIECLPKYAPGLNDIEVVWSDLKAYHLGH